MSKNAGAVCFRSPLWFLQCFARKRKSSRFFLIQTRWEALVAFLTSESKEMDVRGSNHQMLPWWTFAVVPSDWQHHPHSSLWHSDLQPLPLECQKFFLARLQRGKNMQAIIRTCPHSSPEEQQLHVLIHNLLDSDKFSIKWMCKSMASSGEPDC